MLHERSRPVHELAASFDISRPAISRHLKVLKDAGLVIEEKVGRENVYALQRAELKPMQEWLEKHRTAKASRKAAKPTAIVEATPVAPAVLPEPEQVAVPLSEPIIVTIVPEPAPIVEPVVAEAAPEAEKPARKPRAPREVVAPPPPAAPQLSFFDL